MEFKEFEEIINTELNNDKHYKCQTNGTLLENVKTKVEEIFKKLHPKCKVFIFSHHSELHFERYLSKEKLVLKVRKKVSDESENWERRYDFKQVVFEKFYDDNGMEIKTFEDFVKYCDMKIEARETQSNKEIQAFVDRLDEVGLSTQSFMEILDMWERLGYLQKKKLRDGIQTGRSC